MINWGKLLFSQSGNVYLGKGRRLFLLGERTDSWEEKKVWIKRLLFCSENEKKRPTADDGQYEEQGFFFPICRCEYINSQVKRAFPCTRVFFFP